MKVSSSLGMGTLAAQVYHYVLIRSHFDAKELKRRKEILLRGRGVLTFNVMSTGKGN